MSVQLYFMDIMLLGAYMHMIVHHPFSRGKESKMINHKINLYKDRFKHKNCLTLQKVGMTYKLKRRE